MKKILIAVLALMLCMPGAFALRGSGYPAYDGSSPPNNFIGGLIDGQSIRLDFDNTVEYSYIGDGYLQACFFSFDQTKNTYFELYLLRPSSIAADTTLTPQTEPEGSRTCVSAFEITGQQITEYFAGQDRGAAYPQNTSYTVCIHDVQALDEGVSISGSLDAVLGNFVNATPTGKTLAMTGLKFHFVLPFGNDKNVQSNAGGQPAPAVPAFTLPPDYAYV